jgi:MFS family permease
MFGMFFIGALYLRRVLGYDPLQIGLAFLPVTLSMGLLSIRYSERLITRVGARPAMLAGLLLIAAGLVVFAQGSLQSHYLTATLPAMLLLGSGAGACFPALMAFAMAGTAPEDAGLASGLLNTTAQVGGALGLAVLATLSTTHSRHLLASGHSTAAALTGGYHLAFWIAAGLVLAAAAITASLRGTPSGLLSEAPGMEQPASIDASRARDEAPASGRYALREE